jgi:hypothetical protein
MPSVQDCGRAFVRVRQSRLARRLFTPSAISLFALASTFAACSDSPSTPTAPRDASLAGGDLTAHAASVAYPIVTIQPKVTTIAVGSKVTLTAKLSEGSATWMGKETTWRSSDTTVLSVKVTNWGGSGGDEGIFTAKKVGKATITATTESQTVGSMAVTVTSSSGGSTPPPPTTTTPTPAPAPAPTPPILAGTTHQPSGYIAVINTGPLTSGPTGHNTSWTSGGPIPLTWTLIEGTPAANIGLASAGSSEPQSEGYRLYFPAGQSNDAAVAVSLPFTPVGGGSIYARWRIRLGSSWSLAAMNANACKLFAPKDVNNSSDDIVMAYLPTGGSYYAAGVGLQGPTTTNIPDNNTAAVPAADNYAAGVWTQVEVLIVADSPAGAHNGKVTVWVNGALGGQTTGVSIFGAGDTEQWRNWSIYAARAVYTGVQSKTTFEDIDNLFVAVSPK